MAFFDALALLATTSWALTEFLCWITQEMDKKWE